MTEIQQILAKQRHLFNSNQTKDVNYRIAQLKKIKKILKVNETLLYDAIYKDFGKSEFETYISELSLIYDELNGNIKNIKKWNKRKRVSSGLVNFPAKSYVVPEPLGSVLVIGAWNYPYQLSLVPAIAALAAGNTVILKPSELPSNTANAMATIINQNFSADYFYVHEGGVKETTELLKERFDKIFFTGSTAVGKIVYQAAAKHLTPVTLELGGKSPTFVLSDTDIKMTAKRIVWAKFLNAGQTCIAPDYVLVHKSIESAFLKAMKNEIDKHYKVGEELKHHYSKVINTSNFDRLNALIKTDAIYCGGETNREERFMSPTLLSGISFEDEIMQDEIFGPILPVISFSDLDSVIKCVKDKPKPLACYIYSKNRKTVKKLLSEISFGGGAVNDSVMHIANTNLPFGGVGFSGMGNYHGKFGFQTFSHHKSILEKPFWFEPSIKYSPYSKTKLKIVKWLFE